jgi:hypothetical protein
MSFVVTHLPSPQACPRRAVCFSRAASTNLDTVSNRDSLLRDALSQSATRDATARLFVESL